MTTYQVLFADLLEGTVHEAQLGPRGKWIFENSAFYQVLSSEKVGEIA